jgi:hypothetical protein
MGTVPRTASGLFEPELIRSTYDELGWVVLPQLFSDEQLAPMERRLQLQVEEQVTAQVPNAPPAHPSTPFDRRLIEILECVEPGEPMPGTGFSPFHIKQDDVEEIGGELAETGARAVHDLVTAPELLDVLASVLGPSITYSYAGICRTRLPDATDPPSRASLPFPLHQDSQYYDTAHFTGGEAGTVQPGLEQSTEHLRIVTVWMPLVDTDERNGCLRLIPGSHRWGMHAGARDGDGNMRAHADVEARCPAVSVPAQRGTCILFDNLVFHGSGPNLSDRVRWSLDWRYAPTLRRSSSSSSSSSVGSAASSAAEWWVEHMDDKPNDYGPAVVRGRSREEEDVGEGDGEGEGEPPVSTLDDWLHKARLFAEAAGGGGATGARL